MNEQEIRDIIAKIRKSDHDTSSLEDKIIQEFIDIRNALRMALERCGETKPCQCPDYCTFHGYKVFREQKDQIKMLKGDILGIENKLFAFLEKGATQQTMEEIEEWMRESNRERFDAIAKIRMLKEQERGFVCGRPVVTREEMANMDSPLPPEDPADLEPINDRICVAPRECDCKECTRDRKKS